MLSAAGRDAKLSAKLNDWWILDFAAFRTEVKKAFRKDIPVAERNAWEEYLKVEGVKVRILIAEIESAEREIDQIVYKLFDLTSDDIALIEGTSAAVTMSEAA